MVLATQWCTTEICLHGARNLNAAADSETRMDQRPKSHNMTAVPMPRAETNSGAGMDRKLDKVSSPYRKLLVGGIVLLALAFVVFAVRQGGGGRSLQVQQGRVVISEVSKGIFEDFIPVRGRVTPLQTVFLDSIEGGRVERRLVEDGAIVEAGETLVILSNTSLQLDVTRNEAMAAEQLNNMRTIELQLEQNRLQHKRNLVELNYQIKRLSRQVERQREIVVSGGVSKSQLEDSEDELEYYRNRREVTLESQATDANLQETQLVFLRETSAQLENNVAFARQNLDTLNVRAPVAGKLSGFDVEVGQSIERGGRLGQIDNPDEFKLRVSIDEFYLGRVDIGQAASFERGGDTYPMTISKLYPQVSSGQFEVDMVFAANAPEGIRRGQTIQLKLTLGDATPATLIPNGAFFQDTGGNWIFVVTADGSEAVRRTVRLGRRNSRYIEVLDGLDRGEQVVTSPYTSFRDMDRLKLSGE
jgi:HlyD family secretion protein